MTKAYHIIISGRVTGVGFRYSTKNFVERFSEVRGYVRNMDYGKVEAVIQGNDFHLKEIIEWLRHGPSFARVDEIKVNEIPLSDNLNLFSITT